MRASRRPSALRPRSRRASAGALVAHVRFCGARPAHLNLSKVSALALDCAEIFLSFANATHISSRATKARSGLEGWLHEAEAVTAGDADGGKRDAADPATGGIPTEPGDGRPRRMRTRRSAGIRRSRKCAGAKRRVAASEAKRPKGPQGATCAAPPAAPWLSADRMCWAGNAAADSRARLGRRDDWRWTRPRRQSGDCREMRRRKRSFRREDSAKPNPKGAQASAGEDAARRPPPGGGEVAAAFPAP